jgi:hypothetical protein
MGSDGQARPLSLSISFLWLVGCLIIAIVGSLGLVVYLWVEAVRARDSLVDRLEYLSRQSEMSKYQQDIKVAPDQARRLLEELDLAALAADTESVMNPALRPSAQSSLLASNAASNQAPTNATSSTANTSKVANENVTSASGNSDNVTIIGGNSDNITGNNDKNVTIASGNNANLSNGQLTAQANSNQAGLNPAVLNGSSVNASANLSGLVDPQNVSKDPTPKTPESEAWAALWAKWPAPGENVQLAVENFERNRDQFTFILKQTEPGQRAKGRSAAIFAVADAKGQVKLASFPEFDLKDQAAGFKIGARYNIVASKVVRGKVTIPSGGKLLSVTIVAWDEDSQDLVFRRKIQLNDR